MTVYLNGQFVAREAAVVSVYDHGLLYGDGIFEGIRIYSGKIFRLAEHIRRFFDSARAILLELPLAPEALEEALQEGVKRYGKTEGYIRLVATRGPGDLGLDPDKCTAPTLFFIIDTISLYPEKFYLEGIPVVTASSRRLPADGLDPRVKTLNYLNNIMAKVEAKQAGCIEAVMLNHRGEVAECTADNIFIVRDRVLSTPASHCGILQGITRQTVLELAGEEGIAARETVLTRFDLYTADECFMTGSGAEIVPVVRIDGRTIGSGCPGEVTGQLRRAFRRLVGI
ncbi:MAG: branched-chain amino acid aminotransferase [Desulfobulbaceae bacterium BRH_c16a]|nr:MAG: branched-chain amino acid aminotransferase [Desulfobulbaceae bacterium BRH_c16a]